MGLANLNIISASPRQFTQLPETEEMARLMWPWMLGSSRRGLRGLVQFNWHATGWVGRI